CGSPMPSARTTRARPARRVPDKSCSATSVPGLRRAFEGALDLHFGVGTAGPARALDRLTGFQGLVDLEAVLDLQAVELRNVVDVTQVFHARVGGRHAQDLVIAAGLVLHAEHPDRTATDQASGEGGLLEEDEGVERITVFAQGVVDVAVVGGVLR